MLRLPGAATTPPVTDLEIRQVTDATGLAAAERVLIEGYPLPELLPFQPGALYDATFLGGTVHGLGRVRRRRTARHRDRPQRRRLTVVENVASCPPHRGRSTAGAALTWTATTHHPTQPAVLIASDAGQPVYNRLSYHRLERWTVRSARDTPQAVLRAEDGL